MLGASQPAADRLGLLAVPLTDDGVGVAHLGEQEDVRRGVHTVVGIPHFCGNGPSREGRVLGDGYILVYVRHTFVGICNQETALLVLCAGCILLRETLCL